MSNYLKITTSLSYSNGVVRVSLNTLEGLKYPKYIALLINEEDMIIAYQPSNESDRSALKVKYSGSTVVNGKIVCSCKFTRKVFHLCHWNVRHRYQIPGRIIENKGIAIFDLKEAKEIVTVIDESEEE